MCPYVPLIDFDHKPHLKKKGSVRADLLTDPWGTVSYTEVEDLSRLILGSITFPLSPPRFFHCPGGNSTEDNFCCIPFGK